MIFQKGHFKNIGVSETTITKALNESRTFSSSTYDSKVTVFLSHKHSEIEDREEAKGVIKMLEDLGIKVYVDSMDIAMPKETCGETATRIKQVIKHCDKFILLATNKAIESVWCNWELGIGDVHKYIDNIAMLPIKEMGAFDSQYKGSEYMQIYPSIDYKDGSTKYSSGGIITKGYYFCTPKDKKGSRTITPLADWLKR